MIADLGGWLTERLDEHSAIVVPWSDVVQRWSADSEASLLRSEVALAARLFARLGVGLEPDVRFGGAVPRPGTSVVLFALPDGATAVPSPGYAAACVVVHLAAVVAAADGTISVEEQQRLAEHLEHGLRLDAAERARLEAHLAFLAMGSLNPADTMRRVVGLPAEQRADVGRLLVDVAAADGRITPEEVQTLMTLFEHLGLSQAELFDLLRTGAGSVGVGSDEVPETYVVRPESIPAHPEVAKVDAPTDASSAEVVSSASSVLTTHTVALEPVMAGQAVLGDTSEHGTGEQPVTLDLDPSEIDRKLAEDAAARVMLEAIFGDDEADNEFGPGSADTPDFAAPASSAQSLGRLVWGLDVEHVRLALMLTGEPKWSRVDVADLASGIGLGMLNGAIEMINEAAFENCDEPLLDDEDPLVLNAYAADRLAEASRAASDLAASDFADGWRTSANAVMGIEPDDPVL